METTRAATDMGLLQATKMATVLSSVLPSQLFEIHSWHKKLSTNCRRVDLWYA